MTTPIDKLIDLGHAWRRIGIIALLCIGLAALTQSDTLHEALIGLLTVIESVIADRPVLGAALFILFAAVSALFAFVSIAAIVPVAVYAWGPFLSIAFLWMGWLAGGLCSYLIGRHLGRPVLAWIAPQNKGLHKLEKHLKHNSSFGLVVLFQLALPSEIPGYVLGLARYSLLRYLCALGLAELPYAIATVLMGQSFVERHGVTVLMIGAGMVATSVGLFFVLRRKLYNRE